MTFIEEPLGLPHIPDHPVDAPYERTSAPMYWVPEDYVPKEGWWAKVAPNGVDIFEGTYRRGIIYTDIPQGNLSKILQVGLEIHVPYKALRDLIGVLSWSATPATDDINDWRNAAIRRIEEHGNRFAYSTDLSMTRKSMGEQLEHLGVNGAAKESILRETAPIRHNARVQATMDLAMEYAKIVSASEDRNPNNQQFLIAATMLLADLMGVGGTDGVGGNATARMTPFNRLGKGRKLASDGPAYMAAAESALNGMLDSRRLIVDVTPVAMTVRVVGWDDLVIVDSEFIQPHWLRTIAREGLRRSLGMSPWFSDLPSAVEFNGYSEDWAAAVNRIEAEIEVDSMTIGAEVLTMQESPDGKVLARIATPDQQLRDLWGSSVRFKRDESKELVFDDDWFEASYKRLGVYYDRLVKSYTDLVNGRQEAATEPKQSGSW